MCSCVCACDIMYGVKISLQLQCGEWIRQRPGEPPAGGLKRPHVCFDLKSNHGDAMKKNPNVSVIFRALFGI